MSTQVLLFRSNDPGATVYTGISSSDGFTSSSTQGPQPWSVGGTFRNLRVTLDTAPGAGTSRTFAVDINGVTSSVSVTISDTDVTATDTSNSIAVAAGDKVAIKHTESGAAANPTDVRFSLDFDSTAPGESGYGSRIAVGMTDNTTEYFPLFNPSPSAAAMTTLGPAEEPVPCAGSLTRLDLVIDASALAVGASYVATVVLNGVEQDGTGATVNTVCTLTGAGPANSTFTLPLAAGDKVALKVVDTNAARAFGYSCRFVATTPGQSIVAGGGLDSPSTSATEYMLPGLTAVNVWSTTESNGSLLDAGVTDFSLSKFYVLAVGAAPGSGKSYTFNLRKNAGDPSGGPTVTINDAEVADQDLTGSASFVSGDTLSMRSVPASAPAVGDYRWALTRTVSSPKKGVFLAGADGTVTSTRTALFNLDDTSRTVSAETSLVVGGNLMLIEQASAPAGVANSVRLFTEDNGSGKTRLMAQFGTGSAVQVAIEP